MSYNDAVSGLGGTPVGVMTHEEAKPIVAKVMRKFLQVPEGEDLVFDEQDFAKAIQAMPIEEYTKYRAAIAAFRLNGD